MARPARPPHSSCPASGDTLARGKLTVLPSAAAPIAAPPAHPPYISCPASGDSSRKGEPSSSSRSMRSRGSSLPRDLRPGHACRGVGSCARRRCAPACGLLRRAGRWRAAACLPAGCCTGLAGGVQRPACGLLHRVRLPVACNGLLAARSPHALECALHLLHQLAHVRRILLEPLAHGVQASLQHGRSLHGGGVQGPASGGGSFGGNARMTGHRGRCPPTHLWPHAGLLPVQLLRIGRLCCHALSARRLRACSDINFSDRNRVSVGPVTTSSYQALDVVQQPTSSEAMQGRPSAENGWFDLSQRGEPGDSEQQITGLAKGMSAGHRRAPEEPGQGHDSQRHVRRPARQQGPWQRAWQAARAAGWTPRSPCWPSCCSRNPGRC